MEKIRILNRPLIPENQADKIYIHLVIRRTKEYLLNPQNMPNIPLKSRRHFMSIIKDWDIYFKIPFWEFKKQLAQIALKDMANWQFDTIRTYMDANSLILLNETPGHHYVIPIDEDDWLLPQTPQILKNNIDLDKHFLVNWKVYRLINNKILSNALFGLNMESWVISNAYAQKAPFWDLITLERHAEFTGLASSNVNSTLMIEDPVLGFKLNNPASLSIMVVHKTTELLYKATKVQLRYLKRDKSLPNIGAYFSWKLESYIKLLTRAIE